MKQTVLITGGGRGIGRAIADDLVRDHNVIITYCSNKPPAKVFTIKNPGSLAIRADFSDPTEAEKVIELAISAFGQIDKLVNNAAILEETSHDVVDPVQHAKMYQVNVTAPATLLTAASPHMPEGSAVVNIASVNAQMPPDTAGVYAASKAALVAMTKSQAKAFGKKGIRVNALAPGLMERPYDPRPEKILESVRQNTALGRVGEPQDIVGPVRFLLSDSARFMTGEVLTVSGGYRL